MSFPGRSIQPQIRQPSMAGSASFAGQPPALVARVNEKKAELENLRELRDLSAAVASQMEALEQKLATLSDGTEGIDCPGSAVCQQSLDNQNDGQGSD
jgi:DASH complex subunit DAD2